MNHRNFRVLALVILALFCVTNAFAAVGVKSAGTNLCTASDVNFSTNTTVTCDGSTATVVSSGTQTITGGTINGTTIGATSPAAGGFTSVTVTGTNPPIGTTQYSKILPQYTILYAWTASAKPASGAPAGAVLAVSNANNQADCGATGGGTTFVVCVSDGTNWKSLRSGQTA